MVHLFPIFLLFVMGEGKERVKLRACSQWWIHSSYDCYLPEAFRRFTDKLGLEWR